MCVLTFEFLSIYSTCRGYFEGKQSMEHVHGVAFFFFLFLAFYFFVINKIYY